MVMADNPEQNVGKLGEGLLLEHYKGLCSKLDEWRFDEGRFEARKTVLSFVVGLRVSALLTYAIRNILRGTNLTASWGAIIDEGGNRCSRECDVIVHKGAYFHAWNGGDDVEGPVMDFRFIRHEDAELVISCKSRLTAIDKAFKDYVSDLAEYVDRVWLFAECCERSKIEDLRKKALEAGYEAYWYLYAFDKGGIDQYYNELDWIAFTNKLKALGV